MYKVSFNNTKSVMWSLSDYLDGLFSISGLGLNYCYEFIYLIHKAIMSGDYSALNYKVETKDAIYVSSENLQKLSVQCMGDEIAIFDDYGSIEVDASDLDLGRSFHIARTKSLLKNSDTDEVSVSYSGVVISGYSSSPNDYLVKPKKYKNMDLVYLFDCDSKFFMSFLEITRQLKGVLRRINLDGLTEYFLGMFLCLVYTNKTSGIELSLPLFNNMMVISMPSDYLDGLRVIKYNGDVYFLASNSYLRVSEKFFNTCMNILHQRTKSVVAGDNYNLSLGNDVFVFNCKRLQAIDGVVYHFSHHSTVQTLHIKSNTFDYVFSDSSSLTVETLILDNSDILSNLMNIKFTKLVAPITVVLQDNYFRFNSFILRRAETFEQDLEKVKNYYSDYAKQYIPYRLWVTLYDLYKQLEVRFIDFKSYNYRLLDIYSNEILRYNEKAKYIPLNTMRSLVGDDLDVVITEKGLETIWGS